MKVAVYYSNNDIRIEERPIPKISKGEILLKVISSGICGSDVMEWYRIKEAPKVLGHEVTGIVEKVAKDVKKFKVGDRIFVTHHVPCNKCKYCLQGEETVCKTLRRTNFYPGGFSQYIRIPKINVEKGTFLLPREISFDEGTFIEPLACVIRSQRKAGIEKGHNVLIIGSGVSGLLHIQLAKLKKAKKIAVIDINPYRLKIAKKFGANFTANANENLDEKFDRVIVCTSAKEAIEKSFKFVDNAGTILFFAPTSPESKIEMPFNELWFKCIKIISSYAAAEKDIKEAIKILKEKKMNLKGMITHKLPLQETLEGFKIVSKADRSMKVIIKPQE
ncbi:MAG: alcohol dehydrogenase catalytic domain-containing protein [Candidatus Altiarchaeota archaeon]